jgi:beta-glucosidase
MPERSTAAAMVAELPLQQRIALVAGRDFWTTQPIADRVPSVLMTDGPHGLRKEVGPGGPAEPATCFPTAAALAATWDLALVEEVGAAIGREARAAGVAVVLGPGLNLKRHPLGGRNFEYFAEDPLLSGTLAAAMVRGLQGQGVGACVKHFAVNNGETRRMVLDTLVDERTLRELYLRGFEIALSAGPAALMTAYNLVNGQYCSDHEELVGRILRQEWGYQGLVMSDWGGTNDRVAGLRVGMDLEMPGGAKAFDAEVAAAVEHGRLAEEDLDRSAARVVELAQRWHRTDPAPGVDADAHHALARRTAAAGCILLSNDGILPVADPSRLALIGAFAETPRYQGAGSSQVTPTQVDALRQALPEARYAAGYNPLDGSTTPTLLAEAAAAARTAQTVVLVLGLPERLESEAWDRSDWGLPEGMEQLAQIVMDVNPRTVVVLTTGASVAMPWGHRAAAILQANLAGQASGSALADVLTGAAEPGGRLAESIPFAVADLPADAHFPGTGRQVQYRETWHVGYRSHESDGIPARFPFGHGLSYTTFGYGPVTVTGEGTDRTAEVTVTNTGARHGSEVVQVYLGAVDSAIARPAKELRGFTKLHLAPGEAVTARIPLDERSFSIWDVAKRRWVVVAGQYRVMAGSSAADIRAEATVEVTGEEDLGPVPGTAGPVATADEFAALLGRPIPDPTPPRPFSRTSTLADLQSHPVGRGIAAMLVAAARRQMAPSDDPAAAQRWEAVIREGTPLRSFVQLSGRLSMAAVDRTVAMLNGEPRRAIGRKPRNAGPGVEGPGPA